MDRLAAWGYNVPREPRVIRWVAICRIHSDICWVESRTRCRRALLAGGFLRGKARAIYVQATLEGPAANGYYCSC